MPVHMVIVSGAVECFFKEHAEVPPAGDDSRPSQAMHRLSVQQSRRTSVRGSMRWLADSDHSAAEQWTSRHVCPGTCACKPDQPARCHHVGVAWCCQNSVIAHDASTVIAITFYVRVCHRICIF